ncbi:MAG: hypothetical protein ACREIE_03930 [Nitrospiraceae bacterium]
MRHRIAVVFAGILALMVIVAGLSIAAATKQYQFTGTVTEVDAKSSLLRVDKGGDVWEFSTTGMKDLKTKKGDKITVYYEMIAKKVEKK